MSVDFFSRKLLQKLAASLSKKIYFLTGHSQINFKFIVSGWFSQDFSRQINR